jgi:hypothetical protein
VATSSSFLEGSRSPHPNKCYGHHLWSSLWASIISNKCRDLVPSFFGRFLVEADSRSSRDLPHPNKCRGHHHCPGDLVFRTSATVIIAGQGDLVFFTQFLITFVKLISFFDRGTLGLFLCAFTTAQNSSGSRRKLRSHPNKCRGHHHWSR